MIDGTYGVYKGEVHRISRNQDGTLFLYPNSESEIDDGAVAAQTKKKNLAQTVMQYSAYVHKIANTRLIWVHLQSQRLIEIGK